MRNQGIKTWVYGFLLLLLLISESRLQAQTNTAVPSRPSPETALRQRAIDNPKDLSTIQRVLDIYQQTGRLKTANRFIIQIFDLNADIPVAILKQGVNNSLALKDYMGVVQFSRLVNVKSPQDADNLNSMGFALYNLKKYGVARAAFEMSVYLDPQNYRSLTNLARDFAAMGNQEKSKEFYQKALTINPNYQLAKNGLSRLQQSQQRPSRTATRKTARPVVVPKPVTPAVNTSTTASQTTSPSSASSRSETTNIEENSPLSGDSPSTDISSQAGNSETSGEDIKNEK